jgi:hypothetical protein
MYNLAPEIEALFFRMKVLIGGKSALRWPDAPAVAAALG